MTARLYPATPSWKLLIMPEYITPHARVCLERIPRKGKGNESGRRGRCVCVDDLLLRGWVLFLLYINLDMISSRVAGIK